MDIQSIYQKFLQCKGVSTDTRSIQKDNLFIALKGGNFNGNRFAKSALTQGAKFAIIDDANYEIPGKTILCDDSLTCLQALARTHRREMDATILAITGTNGKTTSKELAFAVMNSHFNCIATEGNLNNHIGVPLSLLRIKKETEFAIIEMGANHPGEIKILSEIAEPDFGVITNVGQAHIEGFGSFEGVKKTKAELYDFLRANNGITFLNIGNHHLLNMLGSQEIVSYALNQPAYCTADFFKSNHKIGLVWKSDLQSGKFTSNLQGAYNAENLLLATCIGNYFSVPSEKIDSTIEEYTSTNQRSEIKKTNRNTLFLDLYNANPSSVELAVKDFHNTEDEQIVILGDMKELGSISKEAHLKILHLLQDLRFHRVLLAGEAFYQYKTEFNFEFFPDTSALVQSLENNKIQDKWIIIKGSRSMALERVIPFL
ncbi:MAG: UDP-N-acetylmuramoyl-tripeptide--D-alanyl-D-alanine ligase [Bacteroidales bacterium]|jgi:UDP-N-acetylmuramoyl-tripeptide--D-alanyl-D-alanine ligase|nr:UDP-N-acetylmuramoyl-tripeptide--D-alanyl-D-alanine ligase [Bacteroidales bacterium]